MTVQHKDDIPEHLTSSTTLTKHETAGLVSLEQESDGRWIASVDAIPGVMRYGRTPDEACAGAVGLARTVMEELFSELRAKMAESPLPRP